MDNSQSQDVLPGDVLVVDDNDTNRLVLVRMLGKCGLSVDVACHGVESVAMFKQHRYALVLMDLRMPVMDGFEAVGIMRRMEKETGESPTPIVALSAHIPESDPAMLKTAGFTTSLAKPVSRELLIKIVDEYVVQLVEDQQAAIADKSVASGGLEERSALDAEAFAEHKAGPDTLLVRPDPEFADLASWIVGRLRERLQMVGSLLITNDWDGLRILGHDIRGEGGTIGLVELDDMGKELRDAAVARDADMVHETTQHILRYLDRVVFV